MDEDLTMRQRRARKTKAALFESALKLFKQKGYDAVTVKEIATLTGTAKGSFYTCFSTKSEIILEEFRTIDDFYRGYARNLSRHPRARDKLEAFTRGAG
jgi:TetR/AcrR family transcriptional regulator, fatty acid metabolism regulator protein